MKKLYLCVYTSFEQDDYNEQIVFATNNEQKAIDWVEKAQKLILKSESYTGSIAEKINNTIGQAYYSEITQR
jgi:predicted alternative tryptophan synthase beta-subunit